MEAMRGSANNAQQTNLRHTQKKSYTRVDVFAQRKISLFAFTSTQNNMPSNHPEQLHQKSQNT